MEQQRNKVCGADIHKRFLIATILSRDGVKITQRFRMTIEDLLKFKEWVIDNGCEQVAIESTGTYWYPLQAVLEGSIDLILAHPYKIKHIPGKKTDQLDSEWIAELCLNGLIEPSRVFPKEDRELRRLTRAREGYVKQMTQEKNKIHQALDSSCIKLSSVLSDIFGGSGRYVLNGLLEKRNIEDLLEGIPSKRVKKKAEQIREAIKSNLEISQVFLIKQSLMLVDQIQNIISEIDEEIKIKISGRKGDLAIALSVPGMAFVSATAILAEIGNYNDFDKPEKLAAWCGLVPSLYQSADKCLLGGITKQGSRHIRRMLVEVAFAISRTKNCRLSQFFLKIQAKKGPKVAAVALARKVLCILHHLLVNKEKYEEIGFKKWRVSKFEPTRPPKEISLIEMIDLVIEAGYQVKKRDVR
jgi:transposase